MRSKIVTPPLLILSLLVLGCGGGASGPTAPVLDTVGTIESRSSGLVNNTRETTGLARLQLDGALSEIARLHSRDMRARGFFSHTNPDGATLKQRLEAKGYRVLAAGENIAQVHNAPNPADYAHNLLLDNAEHRENILNARFVLLGVGAEQSGNTVWITQVFVVPPGV